jgi:hypothetical protein
MPYMTDNDFQTFVQQVPGQPTYLFGTFNWDVSPSKMAVSNVALTSNVATLTVQLYEGPVPVVGQLVSVMQTQSTSGLFNVNRVALSGVTLDANGAGTITYALTHANVGSAADSGQAWADPYETPDALANGYSIPVSLQVQPAEQRMQRQIVTEVTFPSLPTTATVKLYGAMAPPYKARFADLSQTVATVAGGVQTTSILTQISPASGILGAWNYLCFVVSSVSGGTNPTIIAKILA